MESKVHRKAVEKLMRSNDRIKTKQFKLALYGLLASLDYYDKRDIAWFTKIPDAYKIEPQSSTNLAVVTLYEVIVTNSPTLEKLSQIAHLWFILDCYPILLNLVFINSFGTVSACFDERDLKNMYYRLKPNYFTGKEKYNGCPTELLALVKEQTIDCHP